MPNLRTQRRDPTAATADLREIRHARHMNIGAPRVDAGKGCEMRTVLEDCLEEKPQRRHSKWNSEGVGATTLAVGGGACCAAASVFAALARGTAVTAAGSAAGAAEGAVGAEVGGAATTTSAELGADATEAISTAAAGAALPPDVDAASFCRCLS
jgi:hypothetical protein